MIQVALSAHDHAHDDEGARDVRSAIEGELTRPLSDEEWAFLVREQYIPALVRGQLTVDEVVAHVQAFRRIFGTSDTAPRRRAITLTPHYSMTGPLIEQVDAAPGHRTDPLSAYAQAISGLLAERARQDEEVKAFQADVLQGRLMVWEEVPAWLDTQRRSEPIPLRLSHVVISHQTSEWALQTLEEQARATQMDRQQVPLGLESHGTSQQIADSLASPPITAQPASLDVAFSEEDSPDQQASVRSASPANSTAGSAEMASGRVSGKYIERHILLPTLRCVVRDPESGKARVTNVVTGHGALGRLRGVVQRLVAQYPWDEAETTRFVLTGLPPFLLRVRLDAIVDEQLTACSRLTMQVDPTLSPSEVAFRYRLARKQILGARYRELSAKHVQLAEFALAARSTTAPESPESGAQRMARWNRDHPEWAYARVTNFLRDMSRAQRRLLHPDLRVPQPLVTGSAHEDPEEPAQ